MGSQDQGASSLLDPLGDADPTPWDTGTLALKGVRGTWLMLVSGVVCIPDPGETMRLERMPSN